MNRPASLTPQRAYSVLPKYTTNAEWQRKHDAGELPDDVTGLFGMLSVEWPNERLTEEEAQYILWLKEQGTMRWLASEILDGDDNQIHGANLIEAAQMVSQAT